MALFLLSLIGIPFTAGFFGKFYVFSAALHSGVIWLTILGLVNSGIAAFYYLRLLTSVYSRRAVEHPMPSIPGLRPSLLVALLLAASATLILGIFPNRILEAARAGASTYSSVTPATGEASLNPRLR
jgi:NADH-quinone oxidoreductase subunit N